MALGSGEVVVMVSAGGGAAFTVTVRLVVAVCGDDAESTTWNFSLPDAAAVGVPEIVPAELSERPAGRLPPPDGMLQVYGVVPPVAARVAL